MEKHITSKTFNLRPELLQSQSMVSLAPYVTGSRSAMQASEIGQAPPIANAEIKLIQSGMEREYGKYTSMVKMPVDAVVERVVRPFRSGLLEDHGSQSQYVIYQDFSAATNQYIGHATPTYGVVEIPSFCQNHHVLGFDYVRNKMLDQLRPGQSIRKDTVLAHSPSLTAPGKEYRYGVNANVCLASLPECRQDGVIIRRGFAEQIKFKGYETITLSFDGENIPLNLYGDDETYKIFPDVGERIRPDGIVFATRQLIDQLTPVQMSSSALKSTVATDKAFRYKGDGREAVVRTVKVYHNPTASKADRKLPPGMEAQCRSYHEDQLRVAKELHGFYYSKVTQHGKGNVALTPELQNLLVNTKHILPVREQSKQVRLVDGGVPLKEWTVEVTYSYEYTPIAAHKMADSFGKLSCPL